MFAKLKDTKLLMAFVGLIATLVNTFMDGLFSEDQIYAFAAIIVAFIMKPRSPKPDSIETIQQAVTLAVQKMEIKKKLDR